MSWKEELNDAAEMWDWWKRQVIRVSMVAGIGVGVLFYIGPKGIAEEIPWHKEFGIGLMVFCAIFVIALSGNGGIFSRAKNLLLGVCCSGIGGLLIFAAGLKIQKNEAGWAEYGLGLLAVLIALFGLERLWATLTGAPALDEEK